MPYAQTGIHFNLWKVKISNYFRTNRIKKQGSGVSGHYYEMNHNFIIR